MNACLRSIYRIIDMCGSNSHDALTGNFLYTEIVMKFTIGGHGIEGEFQGVCGFLQNMQHNRSRYKGISFCDDKNVNVVSVYQNSRNHDLDSCVS